MPLAKKLGLSVDLSVDKEDSKGFAELVDSKMDCGGTMLVAWEHHEIPHLIDAIGAHWNAYDWDYSCPSLTWREPPYVNQKDKCYDLILRIKFTPDDHQGDTATLTPTKTALKSGRRRRRKNKWSPGPVERFQQGFGGSASSPCKQGLAPISAAISLPVIT